MPPTAFYRAIADETRLKCLLLILREEELCVCELTTALAESQPKVSRHLAMLRQCNILRDRRQGQWVFYRLDPDLPPWACGVLAATLDANPDFVAANIAQLDEMGDRPERARVCC